MPKRGKPRQLTLQDLEVPMPPTATAGNNSAKRKRETAESMAAKQKDISVSEFFAKNRHLLGFDNPRKALLTR
jgi:DNA topoisomerase VI subunit B